MNGRFRDFILNLKKKWTIDDLSTTVGLHLQFPNLFNSEISRNSYKYHPETIWSIFVTIKGNLTHFFAYSLCSINYVLIPTYVRHASAKLNKKQIYCTQTKFFLYVYLRKFLFFCGKRILILIRNKHSKIYFPSLIQQSLGFR